MKLFFGILCLLALGRIETATAAMRGRVDPCQAVISRLAIQYNASCIMNQIEQNFSIRARIVNEPLQSGVSINFDSQASDQAQSIAKIMVQPSPDEDKQISDFSVACRADAIEVSFASNGQKLGRNLQIQGDGSLKFTSSGDSDLLCILRDSSVSDQ